MRIRGDNNDVIQIYSRHTSTGWVAWDYGLQKLLEVDNQNRRRRISSTMEPVKWLTTDKLYIDIRWKCV